MNLIYSTKNEIDSFERKIISLQNVNPTDRIDYYNDLFNRLNVIDISDLNNVYKDIIKAVKWTREGEEAQINIEYN